MNVFPHLQKYVLLVIGQIQLINSVFRDTFQRLIRPLSKELNRRAIDNSWEHPHPRSELIANRRHTQNEMHFLTTTFNKIIIPLIGCA